MSLRQDEYVVHIIDEKLKELKLENKDDLIDTDDIINFIEKAEQIGSKIVKDFRSGGILIKKTISVDKLNSPNNILMSLYFKPNGLINIDSLSFKKAPHEYIEGVIDIKNLLMRINNGELMLLRAMYKPIGGCITI